MKNIDFEKKLDEAKEILKKLNDPEITLNESIKLYKQANESLKIASDLLEKTTLEFEELAK